MGKWGYDAYLQSLVLVTPFVNSIGPAFPLPASIFESTIFLFPSWHYVIVSWIVTVSHLPGGCLQQKETQASGAIVTIQMGHYPVGGFNPFEKYYSKWESSPNRKEKKNIWNHYPVTFWVSKFRNKIFTFFESYWEGRESTTQNWVPQTGGVILGPRYAPAVL